MRKIRLPVQEEAVLIVLRNSKVETRVGEDLVRATGKWSAIIFNCRSQYLCRVPCPLWVCGDPLGSKMELCIQMGAARELVWR